MKKELLELTLGFLAGIIDLIPMLVQKLTWDANLSALSLWIISGFLISTSSLKLNPIIKGILISFLILIPSAIIISWKQPISILPILIITLILGGTLGYLIVKLTKK